jgi:hypothetical protein
MANNYLAILADIKTKLESIPDIGKVYDYERWASSWDKFISLFKSTQHNQIRGWEITRRSISEHIAGAYFRHHKFKIRGYMSIDDSNATDKTFQQLIEEVCNVFRNADSGSSWFYGDGDQSNNAPAQVEVIEPRMFGGVLCHYVEINLTITERIM